MGPSLPGRREKTEVWSLQPALSFSGSARTATFAALLQASPSSSRPLQPLTVVATGSVLGTSIRLVRHAGKGKWTSPKALASPDFWEDAKPSKIAVADRPKWMVYDDNYVSEVKRGLKACKVFMWCVCTPSRCRPFFAYLGLASRYPLYWLTYNQVSYPRSAQEGRLGTDLNNPQCNGNLVSQAAVLNTGGLPNDLISNVRALNS